MKSWKCRLCMAFVFALLTASLATPAALAQSEATTADKDETVYVYTTPVGSVHDITVRDLLANEKADATVADKSNLSDIEPASDNVTLQSQVGTNLIWNAQGKEVQYKGTTSDEPPVGVRVAYTLNGQMIAPNQLVGKSGHVTIRIQYTNNAEQTVKIEGKDTTIFTPFVAMSTVSLDRDVFSNIEVTNGRVIDGSGVVSVIGYAMPGLQESLNIGTNDLEIPSYVLIEADVVRFSIGSILTIVTPDVFANMDTSNLDASELTDARDGLSSAMTELANGTNELASGMQQLLEGQQSLAGGLQELSDATSALPNTASALAQGVGDLKAGISSAKSGADQVAAGAAGVADGVTSTLGQLDVAAGDLTDLGSGIGNAQASISTQITALNELAATEDLTDEQRAAIGNAIAALEDIALPDVTIAQTDLATAQAILGKTSEGANGVRDGAAGLALGLNDLASGASQLSQGVTAFSGAMPQLAQGVSSLAQGASQLSAATGAASEGASALASGVRTFNDEGVQELVNKLDESGIASMGSRLEALTNAASDYQSFSGIAEGQTGSVKFLIKTDAISA